MNDIEIDYVRFNLALACRRQELCKLELKALDKQIKGFSRRYDILTNEQDQIMPRKTTSEPHNKYQTHSKQVKQSKLETRQAIINELEKRGIKNYDVVLGYVCFKYKKREYRANTAFETRKILELA